MFAVFQADERAAGIQRLQDHEDDTSQAEGHVVGQILHKLRLVQDDPEGYVQLNFVEIVSSEQFFWFIDLNCVSYFRSNLAKR